MEKGAQDLRMRVGWTPEYCGEKVGPGLAEGWRRVGEGLAKGWRIFLHPPISEFPEAPVQRHWFVTPWILGPEKPKSVTGLTPEYCGKRPQEQ